MTDLLQAHADHARHARQSEHRAALRQRAPRTATMAAYIAALPTREDRRAALAAAAEVAPELVEAIEREVRWVFERSRKRCDDPLHPAGENACTRT